MNRSKKGMNVMFEQQSPNDRASILRQSLRSHSRAAYHRAILAAAEFIIVRDGLKRTKMADIAEAIGVSVGTLYNYFQSKDAIMQFIVTHHVEQLLAELGQPFDSDDPIAQLRQWIARVHGYIERNRELLWQHAKTSVRERDAQDASAWVSQFPGFEGSVSRLNALLDDCIRAGRVRADIPTHQLVWALQTMLQILLLDWFRRPEEFSLIRRGDTLLSLFLDGAEIRDNASSEGKSLYPEHI